MMNDSAGVSVRDYNPTFGSRKLSRMSQTSKNSARRSKNNTPREMVPKLNPSSD